ncbi:MAG: amphi-Trp domain-containing protein [Deltaproteobacteria bacterium]|nr:amphi-Trp domain-containing protein [Deltaproteobacteria bacterium]
MPVKKEKRKRDIEKNYSAKQFVLKLRRLADRIESGNRFRIQVAGERINVPSDAVINIEHERGSSEEELEFQLKWKIVR